MDDNKSAASDTENALAAIKEIKQMYINIIDQSLKLALVYAALEGRISYQTAYKVIQHQGLREV